MTTAPEPHPRDLGRQFAQAVLADPEYPTAALDEHPLSSGYRNCYTALMFLCGRQTGLLEYSDDAAGEFMEGFLAGLLDREA